ncbi:MAG: transposase [Spirochaetales bacterium]|nr:transposase [Spirochaetales bacterium]
MKYRRLYIPGGTYAFTVVTANRKPILIENIERLRSAFCLCLSRYPFEMKAIVVLPDHMHTLWKLPEGDADFSTRWMVIKRKFSSGLPSAPVSNSKAKKREKGIWHRRFWEHHIRDANDWENQLNYIYINPVKHKYVTSPDDWPHSSYHQSFHMRWTTPVPNQQ